jgi:hypothetical protein
MTTHLVPSEPSKLFVLILLFASQPQGSFCGLFEGTGQASEKETLVFQFLQKIAATRQMGVSVQLEPDRGGLVQNQAAYKDLLQKGHMSEHEGLSYMTDLLIIRLMFHFSRLLSPTPLGVPEGHTPHQGSLPQG